MKKYLFILIIILGIVLMSCNKDDDKPASTQSEEFDNGGLGNQDVIFVPVGTSKTTYKIITYNETRTFKYSELGYDDYKPFSIPILSKVTIIVNYPNSYTSRSYGVISKYKILTDDLVHYKYIDIDDGYNVVYEYDAGSDTLSFILPLYVPED